MFGCKRCGYATATKGNLKNHLLKQTPCQPKLNDIDRMQLLNEINVVRLKCQCEWCGKKFSSDQSKYLHKRRHCKNINVQVTTPDDVLARLTALEEGKKHNTKQRDEVKKQVATPVVPDDVLARLTDLEDREKHNQKQQEELKKTKESVESLKMQIACLKTRNTEEDYQLILQKQLNGGHKRVLLGVTDITTETFHAEIKNWDCYKESIGQLFAYNYSDPKECRVYLFGKSPKPDLKKDITGLFKAANIHPFEVKLSGQLLAITDLLTEATELVDLE